MGRFFGPVPNVISSDGFFRGSAGATGPFTWTQVITGFELGNTWTFGTFANGLYLIGATDFANTCQVISSPDLATFTNHNITTTAGGLQTRGVTFGAAVYVAVLDNRPGTAPVVYTSPDLVTWTARVTGFGTAAADQRLFIPVFGSGVFLLAAIAGPHYATSPDGATWTQQSAYVPSSWGQPLFDGVKFVAAVNGSSATPKIATSLDGINWTESTATLTAAFTSGGLPFGVGNKGTSQYVVGQRANDTGNSLNGALTSVAAFTFNDSGAGDSLMGVPVYSGSSWARNNGSNKRIVSSGSGTTWKEDTVPATASFWGNIAYGAGHFIAVGGDNGGNNMLAKRGP